MLVSLCPIWPKINKENVFDIYAKALPMPATTLVVFGVAPNSPSPKEIERMITPIANLIVKARSIIFLASVAGLVSAAELKPAPAPNAKLKGFTNSRNAEALPDVIKGLVAIRNRSAGDPFQPLAKPEAFVKALSAYSGKPIYIPIGVDSTGPQALASLGSGYQNGHDQLGFFMSTDGRRDLDRYLFHVTEIERCNNNSNRIQGNGFSFIIANIASCSSDIGTVKRCEWIPDAGFALEIRGISLDKARDLSGNLERYVTPSEITDVFEETQNSWRAGEACSEYGYGNAARLEMRRGLVYEWIDKRSGKALIKLNFSR